MTTNTSIWMRRLAAIMTSVMVFTSFVGQASARILFQDDTVGAWESDQLQIGANDAGAVNTSIKFGADSTGSENGVINWNVTTNQFELDHTTAITGGLSATGQVNFSGATGMRIREVADEAAAACATVKEIVLDTTENKIYVCTATGTPGTWTSASPASGDFEAVYATDADDTLTTSNGAFTIAAGSGVVAVDSTGGIELNDAINGAVKIATGTSTGTVTVGGTGTQTLDIGNGAGVKTVNLGSSNTTSTTTLLSGSGGLNLNANNNQATNIGTGTSTGLVSIGGGSGTVAIDSTSWDISSAGAATGFTGLTSTGTINFSGAGAFRIREVAGITNPGTACTTTGELIMDTNDNTLYVCTNAGTDAWTKVASGGDAATIDGLDSTQFLRSDTSDNFTSGTLTFDNTTALTMANGSTLNVNGVANIGDGGDSIAVNSNTWDISAAGVVSGLTGLTSANGTVSLNNNSGANTTDIGTGTTTGTVSIGGGSNQVAINTSTWDISGAGAASGFTTIDASGNITTSAGTFCVGTTCLNETTAANDSGAFLVGTFDEFTNSNSTNVQDVLDDLDALVGSNAPNVNELAFHPEYPDTVVYRDGTANSGTLISELDATNRKQYYRWSTTKNTLQDIDLRFRYELPADFVATGDLTLAFRTATTTNTDNKVDVVLRNETDNTTCATSSANVGSVANTWETITVTAATIGTGCSGGNALAAGDTVEFQIKPYSNNTNSGWADVGLLNLDYTN